jgi:hypothetical protein
MMDFTTGARSTGGGVGFGGGNFWKGGEVALVPNCQHYKVDCK